MPGISGIILNNSNSLKRMIDTEKGLKEYSERETETADYRKLSGKNYQLERRRTEIITNLLDLKNAKSVLDIGCGEGLQLEYIHKRFPHLNLTGIDISEKRIERARGRVPSANLLVMSATAENLGFANESFDRALCSETLEHLPHPRKVLVNAHKVLKPFSLFVVSTPYKEKLVWNRCIHCGNLTTNGHINSFDEKKISSMLIEANFSVISADGYIVGLLLAGKKLPHRWWRSMQKMLYLHYRKVKPYYLLAIARKQ